MRVLRPILIVQSNVASNAAELLQPGTEEKTVVEEGLMVMGTANIFNLAVTNSITSGLLTITGLNHQGNASIDILAEALLLQSQAQGAIELMGGRVTVDKKGNLELRERKLIGNDSFSGSVPLLKGERTARVDKQWEVQPKSILISPTFKTQYWITDISNSGFTINIDPGSETDQELFWVAIF